MGKLLVLGATIKCSHCATPGKLIVIAPKVTGCHKPMANKNDAIGCMNILPLGFCMITMSPCVPATSSWDTSLKINVRGAPAVDDGCKASCALGGSISVLDAGQGKVND